MRDPALSSTAEAAVAAIGLGTLRADLEPDLAPPLPGSQPNWQRDALAVSARVRAIVARLRPVVVRVLTFWDHVVRSVRIGERSVEVDPSGCYRLR